MVKFLLHVKILISESEKQCQSTEVLLPTLSVKLSLTSPSHTFSPSFPSTTVLMTLQQEKSNIFFSSPQLFMEPVQGSNETIQEGKKESGTNSLAVEAEHEDYLIITPMRYVSVWASVWV